MTIVMEEDAFSSSLSSLSTLSPQSNYQTLLSRDNLNSSYLPNTSANTSIINQNQQSPNGNTANLENCPYAVFIFRSNGNSSSELFEERRIPLDKSCKIGRSVAKIRPEPNNAIFDCKVLSRNHALLWEENGKFYIQDTKSSNGTFLNGNRLGKSNEDSAPFELTSGDIIQFGVDVTENTKKVTHGCITVEVRLFLRSGVEAIYKPTQQTNKVDVQTQELYQLALFLQEAMMREEILNQKLISLQSFIDQAKQTSENGWLTLIQEDRLLSRIDCLEKQTTLNNKNITEEQFKKAINSLREEKLQIEDSAKESIQKLIEEKNESTQKLDEFKSMFNTKEEESNQLKRLNEELRSKILDLAGQNQDLLSQIENFQNELEELKTKYNEKCNSYDVHKQEYENKISDYVDSEKKHVAQIELLIAEKDIQSKQLEGLLIKFEQIKEINEIYVKKIESHEQEILKSDIKENFKIESVDLQNEDNADNDKKISIKNEVLNDLSNNINNELETHNQKESVSISPPNGKIQEEKENIELICEQVPNGEIETNQDQTNQNDNSKINILNIELKKLNFEIEELKKKLEKEINSNFKLKDELNQLKDVCPDQPQDDQKFDLLLREKATKLDDLEKELEEKNKLIEKLVLSKNELINLNLTNVINISKSNDSFDLKEKKEDNLFDLNKDENGHTDISGCLSYDDLSSINDQFKTQVQIVQIAARQFLEDRPALLNKSLDEEAYFKQLEESVKKLEELKEVLDLKKLPTEQIDSSFFSNKKISELESKIKNLEEECHEYKSKLNSTDSVINDLNEGYEDLSLRAKIVSYFSMVPISVLIFAILMAFYPILSSITATDL